MTSRTTEPRHWTTVDVERSWSYFTNPEQHKGDRSHVATLGFCQHLLERLRPLIVLEAGSYEGDFARMAAKLITEWHGMVVTTDPVDHKWDRPANCIYIQDDFAAIAEECPEAIGNASFIYVDSGPGIDWPVQLNIRWQHYCLAKEWTAPGGVVVCDDTAEDWPGVKEIREEALYLNDDIGRGVTVWQKT